MNIHNDFDTLYRKNNFGEPCMWQAKLNVSSTNQAPIVIRHGILGKTITETFVTTHRDPIAEIKSRINEKRKVGYKYLSELKDNVNLPVEGELINYLRTYLPDYRTTADGAVLPMLAKTYDNENNKVFKKVSAYIGQYKINGLRCFISAEENSSDMFRPIKLRFQSREGTYWTSLIYLEEYLLHVLPESILRKMIDEHYILDGELYLPGHTVNEINHFVKDSTCKENQLIQYWCYDIAIENMVQWERTDYLYKELNNFVIAFDTKSEHLDNKNKLIVLDHYTIYNDKYATEYRDSFIDMGFEGLILRNPDTEYQYGKRNSSMIKYKKHTDGIFTIVDIYSEGIKRPDIPLFLLRNDINDSTFEVHLTETIPYQKQVFKHKAAYIGKKMFVEYGERSGINNLPFHVKHTRIID